MKYIDLTHTFQQGMPVYPGDESPTIEPFAPTPGVRDERITTTTHVGTHIDAPAHMIEGGKLLSDFPVEYFVGKGVLIDARGKETIDFSPPWKGGDTEGDLHGSIALILTNHSKHFGTPAYYDSWPKLTEECARSLVDAGVKMVGIDTPSPDWEPFTVHKILLEHGVLIIENLTNLEALLPHKSFAVFALPAKFQTAGASARVIAQVEERK